jgi:succinate-acetate transporter protein
MLQSQIAATAIQDTSANPAPLGLFGFGMTTVLLNIHNAGFFEMNSMILAMGLFYGGLAQVIAGILESRKNNTFGMTAFISYGFFWLTLVGLILMAKWEWITPTTKSALATYLLVWGIFTGLLFVGTLKLNRALQFVFASLTLLFFLLAIGNYTDNEQLLRIAGYEGIICVYKKDILPLGKL